MAIRTDGKIFHQVLVKFFNNHANYYYYYIYIIINVIISSIVVSQYCINFMCTT